MIRWIVGAIPSALLIIFTHFIIWLNEDPTLYPSRTYSLVFILTNLLLFFIQAVTCSALHLSKCLMLGIYCFITILLSLFNLLFIKFQWVLEYLILLTVLYFIYCLFEHRKRIKKDYELL